MPSVVATDGTVTDGPYPETKEHLGGFAVVDVPSREEALWATKIAAACRSAQEVFELLPDPTVCAKEARRRPTIGMSARIGQSARCRRVGGDGVHVGQ